MGLWEFLVLNIGETKQVTPTVEPTENAQTRGEVIDLLEADLTSIIRQIQGAAEEVRDGIKSSTQTFGAIRCKGTQLTEVSRMATDAAASLAVAIGQLEESSAEIGRKVYDATEISDEAERTALAVGKTFDELTAALSEINSVTNMIAAIATQTKLLALNAEIEAARSGVAGKAFKVVANEIKALSTETRESTVTISLVVGRLQQAASQATDALKRIATLMEKTRPIFGTVAGSVEEQLATTREISHNAQNSSKFAANVADGAAEIEAASIEVTERSGSMDHAGQNTADLARKLRTRLVIFLRNSELGDRRRHDRLPCRLDVILSWGSSEVRGETIDISADGILASATEKTDDIPIGSSIGVRINGLGRGRAKIVNRSELGLHLQFIELGDLRDPLEAKLALIGEENRLFIDRARVAAASITHEFECAVASGGISREALFDNEYVPIAETNPIQYLTRAIEMLEVILPGIQEPLLESDSRMVFACAVDRNGYLPVHNNAYSHPQRLGDVAWNTAHSRNRRILDDRTGLAAARNMRPHLIQTYPRDMGSGMIMVQDVTAPIRVFGLHWGAFRTGYRV